MIFWVGQTYKEKRYNSFIVSSTFYQVNPIFLFYQLLDFYESLIKYCEKLKNNY